MRKTFQSPGQMKNSSYYIAPVGVRTHDLPHTVASNMSKVPYALTHSATPAVNQLLWKRLICVRMTSRMTLPSCHMVCFAVAVLHVDLAGGVLAFGFK